MELKDIIVPVDDAVLPWLDRENVDESNLTPRQAHWRKNGYIIVGQDSLGPEWMSVCGAYEQRRQLADGWEKEPTPYTHVEELRRLCCHGELSVIMADLVGEPVGVHLNLCGWVTTGRNWHTDGYLSDESYLQDHYVAAWVALQDVHPDAGPFEFSPGSHWWGRVSQRRLLDQMLDGGFTTQARISDGSWPIDSEMVLTGLFDREIDRRGGRTERFVAKAGEVLLWHPRLWHRGSPARTPGMERRSVISHYSGVAHRKDMPKAVQHSSGGWYFPLSDRRRFGKG